MAREQFMKLIMVLASLSQIFITITSKTRLLWPTSSFSREFIILFSSSSHCASINSRPIGVQCSLSLELNFVWKARHSTSKCPTLCFVLPMFLFSIKSASTRAVESESLKVWKSLKVGKSRKKSDKVGKVGFDFLLYFWQKSTSLMEMSWMLSQKGLLRVTIIVSKQIIILKCS